MKTATTRRAGRTTRSAGRNRARAYRSLVHLGLTDAYRAFNGAPHSYSFWDYQGGAWQKDFGLLIDHLLLSPQAADRLSASGIDRNPRGRQKASDHTPVWCEIDPPTRSAAA